MAGRRRTPQTAATRGQAREPVGRQSPALDFILFKIGILRRLLERYSNPVIPEQYGATVAEWRVLTHLFASAPTTATELSARLCADKAEISRACSSLIAKGHVSRRPDKTDARSVLLAITRSGIELHNRILPVRRVLEDELAAVLTASEGRTLHRALDKLIEHLLAKTATPPAGVTAPKRRRSRPARPRSAPRS
jgi:DNA-binding MarR family transcriptional regulator